jgi:flagellar biogenesis protein FliO
LPRARRSYVAQEIAVLGNTSPVNTPRPQRKTWILVGSIALIAISSGIILPRSLPSAVPAPISAVPAAAASPVLTTAPAAPQDTKAAGKDDLTYTAPTWPEPPDVRPMLLRLGVGTVVVLGLCVGSLWVAKRWMRGSPVSGGITSQLRLIETLPLGNRCALYLVAAGERSVLVGADASGMKTILALTDGFADALAKAGHEEVADLVKEPATPSTTAAA